MFKWYEASDRCYVYLVDVQFEDNTLTFRDSEWFTRGWTLQELIAPRKMVFYDRNWKTLGTKHSLRHYICWRTNIDEEVILNSSALRLRCVAQRMSWAANRIKTREEDIAYCLLGIFRVNLTLLYGEGALSAFRRLQEAIILKTSDESIFAWAYNPRVFGNATVPLKKALTSEAGDWPGKQTWQKDGQPRARTASMLAVSPRIFASCGDMKCGFPSSIPHSVSNRGLDIELPLIDIELSECHPITALKNAPGITWIALLRCEAGTSELLGIILAKTYNDFLVRCTFGQNAVSTVRVDARLAAVAKPRRVTIAIDADTWGNVDLDSGFLNLRRSQLFINISPLVQEMGYSVFSVSKVDRIFWGPSIPWHWLDSSKWIGNQDDWDDATLVLSSAARSYDASYLSIETAQLFQIKFSAPGDKSLPFSVYTSRLYDKRTLWKHENQSILLRSATDLELNKSCNLRGQEELEEFYERLRNSDENVVVECQDMNYRIFLDYTVSDILHHKVYHVNIDAVLVEESFEESAIPVFDFSTDIFDKAN
jgi:hypothetical protein